MKKKSESITFKELKIPGENVFFKVFYVFKNGRSQVMESFGGLEKSIQKNVKSLIIRMAQIRDFKSNNIKRNMHKNYKYGELKPHRHRFFFFIKFMDNIIFFRYEEKKEDSLGDDIYQAIQKEMDEYEKAFEQYIQGN